MKNLDIYEYMKQKDMTSIIKNSLPPISQNNNNDTFLIDALTLKKYITGDITNLIIPYAEYYSSHAFCGITQLKRVKIPDSFSNLDFVIRDNMNLEVVDIGKNINNVSYQIFWGCYNLKAVIFRGRIPPMGLGVNYASPFQRTSLDDPDSDGFIYVPDQSVQNYKDSLSNARDVYANKVKPLSELPDEYNIKW